MTAKTTTRTLTTTAFAAAAALMLATAPATAQSSDGFKAALKAELGLGAPGTAGGKTSAVSKSTGKKTASVSATEGEILILQDFYGKQEFRAIWFDDSGPTNKAKIFLDLLSRADTHGLDPEDYLYSTLKKGVDSYAPSKRARLEVMMSRSFARIASDINAGRLHPMRSVPGLYVRPVRPDPERLLIAAAKTQDFVKFARSLPPRTPQYARLLKTLAVYRALEKKGGWKGVGVGKTLKPG